MRLHTLIMIALLRVARAYSLIKRILSQFFLGSADVDYPTFSSYN